MLTICKVKVVQFLHATKVAILMNFTWEYWFVFPYAIFVATFANASGFSGAVLFQPFFNFGLQLPMAQSIATGIATETIGMTSGAVRYHFMKKIDWSAVKVLLPPILIGVLLGITLFYKLTPPVLRLIVGLVVGAIAIMQLSKVIKNIYGDKELANTTALKRTRWIGFFSGSFSACTGTGVAEMSQPLLEGKGELKVHRANATAIALEAGADWMITIINLSAGSLRFDILLFSVSGVLVGSQLGALVSPKIPAKLLKICFGICVLGIALVYLYMGISQLFLT